jgi:hypothetical protein
VRRLLAVLPDPWLATLAAAVTAEQWARALEADDLRVAELVAAVMRAVRR